LALILNREEVASVLTMKDTIETVEQAFRDLAEGKFFPQRPAGPDDGRSRSLRRREASRRRCRGGEMLTLDAPMKG